MKKEETAADAAPLNDAPASEQLADDETNPYLIGGVPGSGTAVVLEGLDEVDWRSLEDAYGHGGAVPTFLRALASSDAKARDWGLEALFASINHQGGTFSTSVAAVPFLITLACDKAILGRDRVLALLVGLATGEPQWALLDHVYPTLCLGPLSAEVARLLPLLDDDDDAVRAKVIHLLGHLSSAHATILPALGARLRVERDPYLRASLAMAMARASRRETLTDEERAEVERAVASLRVESALGAAVAALARFYLVEELAAEDREALRRLDLEGLGVHPSYAWNRGNVGSHAREIHKATMPAAEVLDRLERGERDCQPRAMQLLFRRANGRPRELSLPEDLSPDQMRFLRWAVTQSQAYYDAFWRDNGLPTTEAWLKRFLGVAPPGPLDRRVRAREGNWPIWKVIHAVLNDLLPPDAWSRVAQAASDAELLEIYDDATGRELDLEQIREYVDSIDPEATARSVAYRDRFYRLLLDEIIQRPGLVKTFEDRSDALLARPLESSSYLTRTLIFAGLGLAAARFERDIDPRHATLAEPRDWSPAMTLIEPLRWGLARLPIDLRWRWFEGLHLVSLTRIEDARGVRHKVRVHNGWQLLDLVPTAEASEALREAITTVDRHRKGQEVPSAELGLARGPVLDWAKDDPLPKKPIAAIARAWGARWKELLASLEGQVAPGLLRELDGSA